MGRSIQAEEHISSHFDDLLQLRVQAEVGILIGKQTVGARDLVLSSIRTPLQDGCEPVQCSTSGALAAKCSSKAGKPAAKSTAGVSMQLQEDWIIEHARQVARMLPGGISVVGLYLFASEAGFQSALNQLCSLLTSLLASQASASDPDGSPAELLLLHYDNGTKKTTIKSGSGPSLTSSGLKVGEIRFANVFSNLVALTCRHSVSWSLPTTTSSIQVHQQAALALAHEGDRISRAVPIVGGTLLPAASYATPLVDALPKETSSATAGAVALPTVSVELLLPLPCDAATAAGHNGSTVAPALPSSVSAGGVVSVSGEVVGVSYAHKREPLGRALRDLQADLQRSLKVRLDLLVEDALRGEEDEAEEAQQRAAAPTSSSATAAAGATAVPVRAPSHPLLRIGEAGSVGCAVALPRRVLLPWRGGLQLCDYLLPDESVESALERAEELLDLNISDATMVGSVSN